MSYNSIQQCIDDHKLLVCAIEIDPGRRNGQTITKYMEKKIKDSFKNADGSFKTEMNKNNFTSFDIELIAIHDLLGRGHDLDTLLPYIKKGKTRSDKIKSIINTSAFKEGKLKYLYDFLPRRLDSKDDLVDFIKSSGYITNTELNLICSACTNKNWKEWLRQATNKKEIHHSRGGWR